MKCKHLPEDWSAMREVFTGFHVDTNAFLNAEARIACGYPFPDESTVDARLAQVAAQRHAEACNALRPSHDETEDDDGEPVRTVMWRTCRCGRRPEPGSHQCSDCRDQLELFKQATP